MKEISIHKILTKIGQNVYEDSGQLPVGLDNQG